MGERRTVSARLVDDDTVDVEAIRRPFAARS